MHIEPFPPLPEHYVPLSHHQMDMAQTLMSEAAINDNNTDFKETPAIEDGHIGAHHDHRENRPIPADSVIEKWSFCPRALPLLGLAAFFASYAFTMKGNVPKF
ncbi:hypothetical protein HYC85_000605 [Camellia sinensis]|uniref:Uncharacterized protein n=1 Tax=Camellia sinensis TaxID=4442 RepID=A0A7J7I4H9_CAMSI|nr:hypothetical protein HYC85_000605 [Camellia sinensis]